MFDRSISVISDAAARLLREKGVLVENDGLLERLAGYGASILGHTARFPEHLSLALAPASPPERGNPRVTAGAELYQGVYLDLEGQYAPITLDRILEYKKLAMHLPGVTGLYMLGCPAQEIPKDLQPLYEKLYCWKWGIAGGEAIWDSALLDKLHALWQIHAQYTGEPIERLFRGTVYLLSPLRFGAVEAAQLMYFCEKGLRVSIGTMGSLGATAPVTRAGALTLQTAERMFICHVMRALWGMCELMGGNSLATLDMRTAAFRYGRPESNALILEAGALAQSMGLAARFHAGLSDAKAPSFEAGVQKAVSALLAAMTGGHGHIAAGLLSVDEIFSPVQMALDGELCRFLNHALTHEPVNEETLAYDTLLEVDHGGMFLDREHTAQHLSGLWTPNLFSRDMYEAWRDAGCRLDVDYARELCRQVLADGPPLAPCICEAEERDILGVINM